MVAGKNILQSEGIRETGVLDVDGGLTVEGMRWGIKCLKRGGMEEKGGETLLNAFSELLVCQGNKLFLCSIIPKPLKKQN